MTQDVKKRIDAVLVCGGVWHDMDFARLELLKLLAEDERVRVRVFEDYSNVEAIAAADFLITYTCNVTPGLEAQEALRAFVASGKRWYALHGTNAILRFLSPEGAGYGRLLVDAPRWAPHLMQTLGSQFIAHPPIAPFTVHVTNPDHPLVQGVTPFETDDELYLMETHGELETLLHCEFVGEATGFVEKDWPQKQHPVLYIHSVGKGQVLYFTLGHCRGHYDMPGIADFYPQVERCAWNLPVFYDLLRRGIAYVKQPVFEAASA